MNSKAKLRLETETVAMFEYICVILQCYENILAKNHVVIYYWTFLSLKRTKNDRT